MTIGPEPMTRTCDRSVRLGTLNQLRKPVEEVVGIVRPRCRFRVVLDGEGWYVVAAQPFDHVVVEAHVAHLDRAERRLDDPVEGRAHGEAVVVRGDLDLARGPVDDRLVDAP